MTPATKAADAARCTYNPQGDTRHGCHVVARIVGPVDVLLAVAIGEAVHRWAKKRRAGEVHFVARRPGEPYSLIYGLLPSTPRGKGRKR